MEITIRAMTKWTSKASCETSVLLDFFCLVPHPQTPTVDQPNVVKNLYRTIVIVRQCRCHWSHKRRSNLSNRVLRLERWMSINLVKRKKIKPCMSKTRKIGRIFAFNAFVLRLHGDHVMITEPSASSPLVLKIRRDSHPPSLPTTTTHSPTSG